MTKKHFTLRLTVVSCLTFLSLFLAGFSCQDHEEPVENILPQVQTGGAAIGGFLHATIQFNTLGNMPIAEYGIVYLSNNLAPGNYVPTLANNKYVFDDPIENNFASESLTFSSDLNIPANWAIYSRAYVLLENGDVVYGNTVFNYSN